MFSFVLELLLIAAGVGGLVYLRKAIRRRVVVRSIALAILGLGVLLMFFSSLTIVPARNVGIPVSLGQPGDVLTNGAHMIDPWASVETFDGTVQSLSVDQQVRLGNGGTAGVDASIQWLIDTEKNNFRGLYQSYRTFDNIRDNVISKRLADALNQVFETYDPLAAIDANGQMTIQMSDLAAKALGKVAASVPAGLKVMNLIILPPKYSPDVEKQINNIITATAATRVADQQKKTAVLIAAANDLIAKGNLTPGVLYQACLNLMEKMGSNLPPAMSCGSPGAPFVITK